MMLIGLKDNRCYLLMSIYCNDDFAQWKNLDCVKWWCCCRFDTHATRRAPI